MRVRLSLACAAVLLLAGCAKKQPPTFSQLAEEFVYSTLALSPVSATGIGYHRHDGVVLDELLDDMSPAALVRQRNFFTRFRARFDTEIRRETLSPEEQADYDIIQNQIQLQLLEFDRIRNYRQNPTVYVELIGNALFQPHVLEYAPRADRVRHIIARLNRVPELLAQARANLGDCPEIWTRVAIEENEGNIGLIEKTIPATVPAELKGDYDAAAAKAVAALKSFQEYLKADILKRTNADWRIGTDVYRLKFRYVIATDLSHDQVLSRAEADVKAVRARMLQLASPLYQKWFGGLPGGADRENKVIAAVLARIAEKHATPETYVADARRDLDEARAFIKSKDLLTLPPRDNLKVIETPEFMRGIYAVGGFAAAPALEPQLGAFYWITPIPPAWPKERIESKLREYNFYKLKLLTIHEAMPGHYVQLEYANNVEPKVRRVLRSVFGNGPYIEGWGQYSTQAMLDAGYLDNSPELRLTFMKEELRVLANAILDIRLHTMGMNDQEALDLMMKSTFQEREEATAKLQRAKLSSVQLPTYLAGWRDWIRVRDAWVKANPNQPLKSFHDAALKAGSVPLPVLAKLMNVKLETQ